MLLAQEVMAVAVNQAGGVMQEGSRLNVEELRASVTGMIATMLTPVGGIASWF